jgi:hypothetical protein
VATTSTKAPPVIKADIRRVLDRMQVQYRENKGGFECIHLPSIDISSVERPTTPPRRHNHHHQQASSGSAEREPPASRPSLVKKVSKLSFGIRNRDRSRDRDMSVDKEREREASGRPSGVTLATTPSSGSSSFFNVASHPPTATPEPKRAPTPNGVAPDVEVTPPPRTASPVSVKSKMLPPIPRDFAASPTPLPTTGEVDREVFESMGNNTLSVRFDINIVKVRVLCVPLVRPRQSKRLTTRGYVVGSVAAFTRDSVPARRRGRLAVPDARTPCPHRAQTMTSHCILFYYFGFQHSVFATTCILIHSFILARFDLGSFSPTFFRLFFIISLLSLYLSVRPLSI